MSYELSQQAPLSNRREMSNMVLFLAGKLVSLLGTSIYDFAIGLYVLKVTGSAMSFALTLVVALIPRIILSPFAGSIADRVDRKLLVVSMDLASGGLLVLVYLLSLSQGLSIGVIYASAFTLTLFNTFFSVSFDASIPNLVKDKRLMKINSMNQSIISITNIVGPALGGVIFGLFGIEYFMLFNGISFIVSGISESLIDFNFNKTMEKETHEETVNKDSIFKSVMKDTAEGFKYLKEQKLLYSIMKYVLFINLFFSGFFVALPYIAINELHLSDAQYGTIYALISLGSFVFAIVLSMLPEVKNKYRIISIGLFVEAFLMIGLGLPTTGLLPIMDKTVYFIYFAIIAFIIGSIVIMINLPMQVSIQRETPDKYRGRVFGVLMTMSMAISPLGYVLFGLLIDILPSYIIPIGSGILYLVVLFLMHRNKELRAL